MQKCNRKYTWQSVLGRFDFHMMDTDLYLTTLDTTAVKTDAMCCLRYKSYEHVVTACPFPSEIFMSFL